MVTPYFAGSKPLHDLAMFRATKFWETDLFSNITLKPKIQS